MCIHVGFYVIWYIWLFESRWWASPPQMDPSPWTRDYIQRGRWVSNQSGFWLVWPGTRLQIPTERSLDFSRLMGWLSYIGMPVWYVVHQPSAWIWFCHLSFSLEKIRKIRYPVVSVIHRHTPVISVKANPATWQYLSAIAYDSTTVCLYSHLRLAFSESHLLAITT